MPGRYRAVVTPLALLAAVVLLYMENPWFFPAEGSTERAVATVLFWALTIVGPLPYVRGSQVARRGGGRGRGPGLHTLPVRKYPRRPVLGTDPDLHRLRVAHCRVGEADRLRLVTFEWYRGFLQFLIDNRAQGWFAWIVTFGEIAVGLGVLLGALTGIAAFFGATMNMSYMLAGSASSNPIMFAFAVGLMLAWRVAGYYGVDRYLLPMLGVPWGSRVAPAPTPIGASPG
jgi:hypothetical protein